MLVLSRKVGEKINLDCGCGTRIDVQFVEQGRGKIRLGVAAPLSVQVYREEIPEHERRVKPLCLPVGDTGSPRERALLGRIRRLEDELAHFHAEMDSWKRQHEAIIERAVRQEAS